MARYKANPRTDRKYFGRNAVRTKRINLGTSARGGIRF